MDELAKTFKALADKTRLQIITLLLAHKELCVCDFVETLGLTQSKTSRHLRYLYHSGLVTDRKDGLWTHYRLHPQLSPAQRTIVQALAAAITPEQKEDLDQRLQSWFIRKGSGTVREGDPGEVRSSDASVSCC